MSLESFYSSSHFSLFEQQMGYGRRAMNLLIQYYEGKIPSLSEEGQEEKQISTLTGDEVSIDRLWLSL